MAFWSNFGRDWGIDWNDVVRTKTKLIGFVKNRSMNAVPPLCKFIPLLGLLFLCSCATVPPPLPADVTMNPGAGRGDWLIAMVRVNGGDPLPFIVDTGCPVTCLDQSLESQLGPRLTSAHFLNFGVRHEGGAYRPPQLSLGNTLLANGSKLVVTLDLTYWSKLARMPCMGILGMDVLKHYCLQMDFQSGQLRFRDAQSADKKDWGRPFPLTGIGDGCLAISENLTGAKGPRSIIDTGDDWDGDLTPILFQQWTNQPALPASGEAHSPDGVLAGELYYDLHLRGLDPSDHDGHSRFNSIGLHVLSQNVVILDFPNRMMYLKRTSDWPLTDKNRAAVSSLSSGTNAPAGNNGSPSQ